MERFVGWGFVASCYVKVGKGVQKWGSAGGEGSTEWRGVGGDFGGSGVRRWWVEFLFFR